jgi:hypothetical protein
MLAQAKQQQQQKQTHKILSEKQQNQKGPGVWLK